MYNHQQDSYPADANELYSLHDETGPELIGKAHPKTISVADAMFNGGVVENGIEAKRRIEDIALNTPTGNYRSKYAWVVSELTKLAIQANESEQYDAVSEIIDKINEIVDDNSKSNG